jgi:hypothetical protein
MTKYKICKFVNENNYEWYQILKKGWFFWSYVSSYEWKGTSLAIKTTLKFKSFEKAKEWIDTIKNINKNKTIKKVECVDY